MLKQYLHAVFSNAWSQTKKRWGDTWQGWVAAVVSFIVGVCYHTLYADWPEATDNALVSLLTGVCATFTVIIFFYIWKVISAPYRLWVKDQMRLARIATAETHLEIAEQLKACIEKGQKLRQSHRSESFNTDVRIWQKTAEGIVKKCGPGELAMFTTLLPPLVRAAIYTRAHRNRDLRALKDMIGKLRLIMGRQYDLDIALKATTPE